MAIGNYVSNLFKALFGLGGNQQQGSSSGRRVATLSGSKPESDWFTGTPEYNEQVPMFTKNQEQAFSQALQQGLGGIEGLLKPLSYPSLGSPQEQFNVKPFDFGPIEQQARTNFNTKTVPSLAQMFTNFGGRDAEGAMRSSAYPAALSSAGSELEQGLASLRAQYGLKQQALEQSAAESGAQRAQNYDFRRSELGLQAGQNQRQLAQQLMLALLQLGSQPRFSTVQHGAQPGFGQQVLGGVGTALGGVASGVSSGLGLSSALKLLERI